VFVDQFLNVDIGQDVAAIHDEWMMAEKRLGVLNAAAGLEQIRLVHELDDMVSVNACGKKCVELSGQMMRVYDKSLDPGRDQMIQRESNERFLENRHERLWHVVRQWTKPRPKSRAKNESPFDHARCQESAELRDDLVLVRASATTLDMAEETIWRGSSSQWKNLGRYLFCALLCVIIVTLSLFVSKGSSPGLSRFAPFIMLFLVAPIFMALSRYLQTKSKTYELTSERLKTTQGVFNNVTETLELYRVKDLETRQPFLHRLAGLENVQLNTSDASTPMVLVEAVPSKLHLDDKIRNQVETVRTQKGVREIDME
jgi:membrane protein YdbS with pleckstrin-like domain